MRILTLLPGHVFGGAEVVAQACAVELQRRGDALLIAVPPGPVASRLQGLPVVHARLSPRPRVAGLSGVMNLRRIIDRFRPDIVHSHHRWPTGLARPICRVRGVRLVHHAHSLPEKRPGTWWGDQTIAVSNAVAEAAVSQGAPSERVTVIRTGIRDIAPTEQEQQLARSNASCGSNRPIVLIISRLARGKGLETVLEVATRAKDACFVIVGSGPLGDWLKHEVRQRSIADRVTLTGWVDRPAAYYRLASCLLMVSTAEGLPLAVLEAAAQGTPSVAARVGGVPEIIENGVDGLLVDQDDVPGTVSALARLTSDTAFREQLADGARQRFLRDHQLDPFVTRVRDVFQHVLQSGLSSSP